MSDKKCKQSELPDDLALFHDAVSDITPLTQDKVRFKRPKVTTVQTRKSVSLPGNNERQVAASFQFSDLYQAQLPSEGPVRYCRSDVATHSLKRLRRGDFYPELVLDLHGLNREHTKLELAALIHTARKENVDCVAVVHGIGSGVLKSTLPHYLVQHPHVRAFHQAPLEYGGQGALLVLLDSIVPEGR